MPTSMSYNSPTFEQLSTAVKKLSDYIFSNDILVSHYDQIDEVLFRCRELQEQHEPDSDRWEDLDLMIEDRLQPMLNHLESLDQDCFSPDFIKTERAIRKEGRKQWKEITGVDW